MPVHPPERVIAAFEEGLNAVWGRALAKLGEPALRAIVGELLNEAATRFPALSAAALNGGSGIDLRNLREHARVEDTQQLREGTRFVLTQVLTVVGRMTAEDLTPALDDALPDRFDDLAPADGAWSPMRDL